MSDDFGRDDINRAAGRMTSKMGAKAELFALNLEVREPETVNRIVAGFYGSGTGILVLLDTRVIFLRRIRGSNLVEEFPIDPFMSIQWDPGLLLGKITIHSAGGEFLVKNVDHTDGKRFVEAARRARASLNTQPPAPPAPPTPPFTRPDPAVAAHPADPDSHSQAPPSGPDPVTVLHQLKQMLDLGLITRSDYDSKKAEVLDRM